ncbi:MULTISPECIES: tRNA (adenosine(37)-N6)-threonylcarbamoyltransferase complex dimerization subunit type 1 TsaB [unclassified Gilliamella]|uniref:tRNA (adenosine(37)-N6)-threonylcarbamoyltransferase complex dimerization subunit type 1 TsaB n=1 Tax=unclassified Gilliamella TaxID=2685620 RepID=UPI0022699BD9|nr:MULTISPECIES: tRNA (adenosine(37)-N6)-threonylcarbamoyltransferase complex dimerization subunit type 1 TsaB [unclassified Gilliamella]MCX8600975.1 tRNA (adenosine(37)-N6)-threonylcarbamoyltransferase complex dimerization subunit type 1 TsaB [Gilliamella sp. B3722]MCX8607496.1 tRNA (adenosine(37)-N6)-threonylcarbamoyltransferase complex dimerization subunit type 1 TsaB [Gilliamella sp. B3771]MCX8610197.1 tRNA (adenosine(37)-N6)-threonylcarbamoyltransferase complex dimerization subunit type 1 T
MSTILAIDTSTEACSVALLYRNEITSDFMISARDHTKQILPMVDKILHQSDCSLSQVDAIAFGQGPGSFTGVRIGIGVAQGLALGLDKPMIGVSTLMTLAQGAYRNKQATDVIAAIDARMNEVYLGQYHYIDDQWQAVITPCVVAPEKVGDKIQTITSSTYCAGTGWQTYPDMLTNIKQSDVLLPDAQDLIVIAEQKWQNNEWVNVQDAEPTYLRNEVTWKKLPGR